MLAEWGVGQVLWSIGWFAADEITRLVNLRSQGVIVDAEFQQLKSKVVVA